METRKGRVGVAVNQAEVLEALRRSYLGRLGAAERAVYEAVVALLPTFHAEFVVTRAHLRALAFLVDARLQVRGDESSKVARAGLGLSALTKASTLEEREKAAESAVKELILEVLFRGWIVDAHAEASSMASFGLSSMVPDFMWKISKTCRELSPQLNFVRRASGLTARDPAVRERWSLELHAEDVKMVADPCTLNHTDQQQEDFVQQSLSLWRGIFDDFWLLLLCAEKDSRSGLEAALDDFGNRILTSTSSACVTELFEQKVAVMRVQFGEKALVGNLYLHVGDRACPNGFACATKYAIVGAQLSCVLRMLDGPIGSPEAESYALCGFETHVNMRHALIHEMATKGFNGAGKGKSGRNDGFYSGSCIDGRITSFNSWFMSISGKGSRFALAFSVAQWRRARS